MNKTRREALSALETEIDNTIDILTEAEDDIKAGTFDWDAIKSAAEDFKTRAEELRDEEQEYYDNMPAGLQGGDKGDNAQAAVSEMESAMEELDLVDISEEDRDNVEEHLRSASEYISAASGY
jgi:uncharacterized coiled-coil DUF342 family protein